MDLNRLENINKKDDRLKIRHYAEIVDLIQKYSENEGLSYEEGFEKAKEKLLSKKIIHEVPVHK